MKNKLSNDRRFGKVEINNELLFEVYTIKQWKQIFKNFIVLNCEHDMVRNIFIYTIYYELFDEIEEGEVIPFYDITMKMDKDKNMNINNVKRR